MKLREVDPLEPQPGDLVRVYTPIDTEDPDRSCNWEEGVVKTNNSEEIIFGEGCHYAHAADEQFGSIYYIVEEA